MDSGDRATLVRICDQAGRPRGTGFVADDRGTVVTSHETVDGLRSVVLHGPGGRSCAAGADAITPLPDDALALIRGEGLGVRPLPIAVRPGVGTGTYVRIHAHGWREARVLGTAQVTYTATDRFHAVGDALELAIGTDGREALRRGGEAAGGPVLDATTGTVLAVLGTALHTDHRAAGLALPLTPAAARDPHGPLAALLRRNAATVPAHGRDLNLAGALELTATSSGAAALAGLPGLPGRPGGTAPRPDPVARPAVARELDAFAASPNTLVCALVGAPGTGRTTELAALAARRARGAEPRPTVWLCGADLRADDTSVADAVGRALWQAGRIVAASNADWSAYPAPRDGGSAPTAERVARLARDADRPLLVLLDSPEEMPPRLAHRLADWTSGTVAWLRTHGVRLLVACRPEHWERAGALHPAGTLHRPAAPVERLPDAVPIGDLTAGEAELMRERYGLPAPSVAAADARHPLTLRLLAEVRAAAPPGTAPGVPGRDEVFAAHLDLLCLRVATRIAAACRPPLRGSAVRRLAVRVAGQTHEAARRCLGSGHGALDREAFEELFPWSTGWASAVLAEGLLVPAGSGYRFAHEEPADWIQGAHLDVDAALHALVHGTGQQPERLPARAAGHAPATGPLVPAQRHRDTGCPPAPQPLPRHRIGPVVQALLLLDRTQGPAALSRRLETLIQPAVEGTGDRAWWARRLLGEVLLRVRDARPHLGVLRSLADRITQHAASAEPGAGGQDDFGPWFWTRLRVGEDERLDLLRRLLPADGPPGAHDRLRHLDVVAERLAADPRGVQPLLCRWFTDERPLPAGPDARVHATVAGVAQALLHTHRHLAVDDLCEALVSTAHPRADELLAALAEDEPSALCRAVDRWAHDDLLPARRVAAATYARLAAAHVTADPDRELLRFAALALLARPGDHALHGPALALLVRDPHTRRRYLPQALAAFRSGARGLPADALAVALTTHPEPVLAAFGARLRDGSGAAEVLAALAAVRTPALARRAAALVLAYVDRHPGGATLAAAYVDRRLEQGPAARSVVFPLVTDLLRGHPVEVRGALAAVLAAPGSPASRPLRDELLDVLLEHEQYACRDLAVPDALLRAAALGAAGRPEARTRELVLRTGTLLIRTPEGATCFDRRLVELARDVPGFALLVSGWLARDPQEWAAVVGPSARRTVEGLAAPLPVPSPVPMRAERRGHGTLRPA
ncbi:serine protease [Streptomyces coeruleoprunus]|uniref:Serine protease n=1 Tax=Streptomyces coeruleoprunus TaxID=285563 RepID=A0ABV9XGN5_9ACTN